MAVRQKQILLIDSEEVLCAALLEQFESCDDFSCSSACDKDEAIRLLKLHTFDLILVDSIRSSTDGYELSQDMRNGGFSGPIILITDEDPANNNRTHLDSIIDDVLLKPVRFDTLEARVRVHLNIYERTNDNTFSIGKFSFLPVDKILVETDTKKIINLTEKETMILQYLYLKSDLIIPRDNLLHEVWGYSSGVTTHTLETHIYRLRKKIEADSSNPLLLITEPGGYRLMP